MKFYRSRSHSKPASKQSEQSEAIRPQARMRRGEKAATTDGRKTSSPFSRYIFSAPPKLLLLRLAFALAPLSLARSGRGKEFSAMRWREQVSF